MIEPWYDDGTKVEELRAAARTFLEAIAEALGLFSLLAWLDRTWRNLTEH